MSDDHWFETRLAKPTTTATGTATVTTDWVQSATPPISRIWRWLLGRTLRVLAFVAVVVLTWEEIRW